MRTFVTLFVYVIGAWLFVGCGGGQQAPPAQVSVQLSATPATISAGDQSTLNWASEGATSIVIDHGIGSVAPSGSSVVSPTLTTVYTAVARGNAQTKQTSATVTVKAPKGSIESIADGVCGRSAETAEREPGRKRRLTFWRGPFEFRPSELDLI